MSEKSLKKNEKILNHPAECIPMVVIQVNNILNMANLNTVVVGALFCSAAFVSEAVSYMTYAKDISEESRRTGKIFYGFMPLRGMRLVVVRWSMYLLSFCQLLGKSLEMAILIDVGGKALALSVLGGEMVAYLLYKLVRRDFRYWLPLPQGVSLVTSLIERVVLKVICDFTGFLHARHPKEMGGFYWLMNMVWTQASVFGAIKLKEEFGRQIEEDAGDWAIKEEDYMTIATVLLLLWFAALLGLRYGSEKEYRNTFYSTMTGKQYCEAMFRSGEDEIKMQVFDMHSSYSRLLEDEIKVWLEENWNDWHTTDRPGWLTDEALNAIPRRLLPGGGGGDGGGDGGRDGGREGRLGGREEVEEVVIERNARATLSQAFFESLKLEQ